MYGAEVKKYLNEHGIKYSFLADKLGIDRKTLYSVLSNTTRMTVEFYVKVCDALKLDLYYFVNIVKNKKEETESINEEGRNYGAE